MRAEVGEGEEVHQPVFGKVVEQPVGLTGIRPTILALRVHAHGFHVSVAGLGRHVVRLVLHLRFHAGFLVHEDAVDAPPLFVHANRQNGVPSGAKGVQRPLVLLSPPQRVVKIVLHDSPQVSFSCSHAKRRCPAMI
jgi:hypothetical protein